ncbi:ankyrin repeat domain-containing protein 26-like isoform X3 [Lepus europaeus]|uniref:ankyrin repeat domain-containing protein 26-like isoform X3 n=1 Tax=Lepus europaeus TaxID=9983 RepID=UPI002B47CEDE|nr:ankyrin repeat domain-containing protein 26-like isoform X3 [Lepus europaeus]XP_062067039.1 ankyrin repeat domain-containing protein 26-like isoform X3 [Lepus europaeus]
MQRQFQEAEARHQEFENSVEKSKEHLTICNSKLECENSKLKEIIKKQEGTIEHLQENLTRLILVDVKHLQKQRDKTQRRQSTSEASLTCCCNKVLQETNGLKNELGEMRRQLQEAEARKQEALNSCEKSKEYLETYNSKLECEVSELKETIKNQASTIAHLQENLTRRTSLQEAEARYQEAIKSAEKSKEHLETHECEISELKETISKLTGAVAHLQENLMGLTSVNLQQRLADIDKHQYISQISLDDIARYSIKLDVETKDLKNKLNELKIQA